MNKKVLSVSVYWSVRLKTNTVTKKQTAAKYWLIHTAPRHFQGGAEVRPSLTAASLMVAGPLRIVYFGCGHQCFLMFQTA
ncbi:hypothetical protein C7N83_07380 [Neisseria iguanae]|uniref:Uncharacterized protein n=1 Tax=Neisseria iguanae TaxID=90242 RepID=A0A2P7TZW3_9NEIS|nr:hypothetical protein C7N83_07380 [Neisseria iguanae]